jgi:hypothetical protein
VNDVTRFIHNMHKRLKEKQCNNCSIYIAMVGPSIKQPDCFKCHEEMDKENEDKQ